MKRAQMGVQPFFKERGNTDVRPLQKTGNREKTGSIPHCVQPRGALHGLNHHIMEAIQASQCFICTRYPWLQIHAPAMFAV